MVCFLSPLNMGVLAPGCTLESPRELSKLLLFGLLLRPVKSALKPPRWVMQCACWLECWCSTLFPRTLNCLPEIVLIKHLVSANRGSDSTHRNTPSQHFFSPGGSPFLAKCGEGWGQTSGSWSTYSMTACPTIFIPMVHMGRRHGSIIII